MKILQICNKPPFPSVDGGTMAMQNLSEALSIQKHQVKIIALNTPKHFSRIEKIDKEIREKFSIEYFFINTKITFFNTLFNLFTSKSFHASRFYSNKIAEQINLIIENENFDLVILDSLFCGVYLKSIKKIFKGKIVLRAHNIEYKLWQRIKNHETNKLKKIYLSIQTSRLEIFEKKVINESDAIIAITKEDKDYLQENFNKKNIFVLPYSVKKIFTSNSPKNKTLNFYHLGSMDWLPNLNGLEWFLSNVWKKFFINNTSMFFRMAGRNMPEHLIQQSEKNLFIEGEISNAENFVNSCDVMICPLFSGGGIRIKIIEALSCGKPIIATKIAAEGIPYQNYSPSPIIIVENENDFIESINNFKDLNFYTARSLMAIKLIEDNFLLEPLSKSLSDFLTFEINKLSN
jgi:glycosyltransferase involved in cell wall biosynthesis